METNTQKKPSTRKKTSEKKEAPAATADKQTQAKGEGIGRPSQVEGSLGKQGASSGGKASTASGELRGGTRQVLITEAVMEGRSGRPAGEEEYPFSMLTPATKGKDGKIVGPSFFIAGKKRAEGILAAARKRHKALFWSRTVHDSEDGKSEPTEGLRIWRGTPELTDIAKR